MVSCCNCNSEMIWQKNFNFDECEYEGEGMVTCFICPVCDTYAEFVIPNKKTRYPRIDTM